MILERTLNILVEELGVDKSSLSIDTSFEKDLNLDSLAIFQLSIAIEEEFDIEISSEEAKEIKTIKDLHDTILNLL